MQQYQIPAWLSGKLILKSQRHDAEKVAKAFQIGVLFSLDKSDQQAFA
jgi:hypothetical protein